MTTPGSRPPGANRPNLSNLLTHGVVDLIRERGLQPGDRLPTARELADIFAVATPTMREALRKLQATGVIDIRHGSGIYVLRAEQRLVVTNPGYGDLESHTILQILEARVLVEPHLAELAARTIDQSTLAALGALLKRAADEVQLRDYLETNVSFHTIIARASGNLVLSQIIESLIELYSVELDLVDPNLALVDGRTADNAVHLEIYDALATGDAAAARDAMERHLQAAQASVSLRLFPEASLGRSGDSAPTRSAT
ncbi:MAG TPA: FCD domain-containing protein [Thermomicrobiales bacterium]|nr:FCD domain-containing protein [Thermomicrobiales bacterium]